MQNTTVPATTKFFEVRTSIYAGSHQRKAFDKDALKTLGFNGVDFDTVKAMLNTAVVPVEAFWPFLAVRKAVQDFLASKGQNHDLLGRIFNPSERLEIVSFLKEKQAEYEAAKISFLADYEAVAHAQIERVRATAIFKGLDPDPLVKAVIEKQPTKGYYARKLEFRFLDSSIELDSQEWASELAKINADLKERAAYDLGQEVEKARDLTNPKIKAERILLAAGKLRSMDFYVNGLEAVATSIEQAVVLCGGVKSPKSYSQAEGLGLSALTRQIATNARAFVYGSLSLEKSFKTDLQAIETSLSEDEDEYDVQPTVDEDQLTLVLDHAVDVQPTVDEDQLTLVLDHTVDEDQLTLVLDHTVDEDQLTLVQPTVDVQPIKPTTMGAFAF